MATQPTQNSVPSESPRDLKFNAGKIDEFVTSLALQYIDRFGKAHLTIEGMKQQVLQQIYNLGWNLVGTFQDGATLSAAGDIIQDEATGVWYRWDDISTLPKLVPAGSTPESTGGIGDGKWLAVDVSDVLRHELAEPTGAWLVGRMNTLQDLLAYDVREGYLYETEGYYSVGDKGSAKYLISDTKGDIPELAYECANGLYAILQHNGTITLEQLGAKGVDIDAGTQPADDSWSAFYKAYKIKKTSLYGFSIKFVTTKSSYYCSKPVLLCTGMVLTTSGGPWITRIYYGGGKVTEEEVPTVAGTTITDAPVVYSDITAAVLVVHNTGLDANYITLEGFKFVRASGLTSLGYGIYAPYASKLTLKDLRIEGAYVGHYTRTSWGCVYDGLVFMGLDTSAAPIAGSVGFKVEPYLGVDAYESGGTSNTYRCVGVSGFQIGFKITRLDYSSFISCYSEKGNDVAMEFHGGDGLTIAGFGLENLSNTLFGALRFYNTRASIDSLTFQFNCQISGTNVVFVNKRSIINIQNISFGRVINTGSSISLFSVSSDCELNLGSVDIPASLIASTGYRFASVSGRLISSHVFTGELGIAAGSGTSNSVTFSSNTMSYKFLGETIWFNYTATWTGGSGSDMQLYGFPKVFNLDIAISAILPTSGASLYARSIVGTNRMRISNSTNASNINIPSSGTIFIQGEYI